MVFIDHWESSKWDSKLHGATCLNYSNLMYCLWQGKWKHQVKVTLLIRDHFKKKYTRRSGGLTQFLIFFFFLFGIFEIVSIYTYTNTCISGSRFLGFFWRGGKNIWNWIIFTTYVRGHFGTCICTSIVN